MLIDPNQIPELVQLQQIFQVAGCSLDVRPEKADHPAGQQRCMFDYFDGLYGTLAEAFATAMFNTMPAFGGQDRTFRGSGGGSKFNAQFPTESHCVDFLKAVSPQVVALYKLPDALPIEASPQGGFSIGAY